MADIHDLLSRERSAEESRLSASNQTEPAFAVAFMLEAVSHEIKALAMRLEIAIRETTRYGRSN